MEVTFMCSEFMNLYSTKFTQSLFSYEGMLAPPPPAPLKAMAKVTK